MRVNFSFKVDRLNAKFDRFARRVAAGRSPAIQAAWRKIGERRCVDAHRQAQAASRGRGPWARLADSTIAAKGHALILNDTGRLIESLLPGRPGNVLQVIPNGVRYGTRDRKAKFHRTGTATMPARPPVLDPSAAVVRRDRADLTRAAQRDLKTA